MGDYTAATLTIHDCPPAHAGPVLDFIEANYLGEDWDMAFGAAVDNDGHPTHLQLGRPYVGNEVACGFVDKAVATLGNISTDIAFTATEDGIEGHNGAKTTYIPHLGGRDWAINTDGAPCWTRDQILAAYDDGDLSDRHRLGGFLGDEWVTEARDLETDNDSVILPRVIPGPRVVDAMDLHGVHVVVDDGTLHLACVRCEGEVCEVEAGDTVQTLALMADDHTCPGS